MIASVFTRIGIPVLASVIAEALRKVDSPVGREAADALDKINGAVKAGDLSAEQIAEANRHAEKMAEMELAHVQATVGEVNQSLRAEIASDDKFVRRMRPTFGYFLALTWAAQMMAIAYVIVFKTEKSAFVISAMENLSIIWAMGLSVLGIYVFKRSEEKRNAPKGPDVIAWNKHP